MLAARGASGGGRRLVRHGAAGTSSTASDPPAAARVIGLDAGDGVVEGAALAAAISRLGERRVEVRSWSISAVRARS